MNKLRLTYSGLLYLDRTLPLLLGQVEPEGIDFNYLTCSSPGDLFRRQFQYAQFEVSELSACSYVTMLSEGDDRFVALPIFVSRNFRHSQVYINTSAGIERPEDLRGKRAGLVEYQITAALWIREFLARDYGVKASDIEWFCGGLFEPEWAERHELHLPADIRLSQIPAGETLEDMLEDGRLDALVTMQPPQRFNKGADSIVRLFPDYGSVEADYFKRTGIFPIMHLVALRRDVYESAPWVALSLYEAFEKAKAIGYGRLRAITGLAVGIPTLQVELDRIDRDYGGDAFPYGVESNRHILQCLVQAAFEQGLTKRVVNVDELFAKETYQSPLSL